MLDDSLFEDPARLAAADVRGLLRAAALAGAQVRASVETANEAQADELLSRPRSVVLLTRPGVAPAVCELLRALTATGPVPVVLAESTPSWVGALDVVYAHTDEAGDAVLAESVDVAVRRGASVVLSAPSEGPVAAAGAGRAWLVPPKIPVPPTLSFAHAFGTGVTMLTRLGLLNVDTDSLAEEMDREAARAHPDHDSTSNPAKTLALRMADRFPLLRGTDEVSTAVAHYGAHTLGCHAGVPSDVTGYAQGVSRSALHRLAASLGSEADLFADPDDAGTEDLRSSLRVFLLNAGYGPSAEFAEREAVRTLPAADVVAPREWAPENAAVRAAVLATRFDLAAVYLGLAVGTVNGPHTVAAR